MHAWTQTHESARTVVIHTHVSYLASTSYFCWLIFLFWENGEMKMKLDFKYYVHMLVIYFIIYFVSLGSPPLLLPIIPQYHSPIIPAGSCALIMCHFKGSRMCVYAQPTRNIFRTSTLESVCTNSSASTNVSGFGDQNKTPLLNGYSSAIPLLCINHNPSLIGSMSMCLCVCM